MSAVHRPLQCLVILAGCGTATAGLAGSVGGSVALTSDVVNHGVSQDCGRPALQGDLHWRSADGRAATEGFLGVWGSAGAGDSDCGRARELDLYAGLGVALGADAHATFTYTHYGYPGGAYALAPLAGRRYDYDALEAQWAWQDRLVVSLAWTPDAMGYGYDYFSGHGTIQRDRSALSYGLQLHQPLWAGLSLSAGAGYDSITDPFGTGFGFWNTGLGYAWRAFSVEAAYFRTAARAERLFGPAAGGRAAVTAMWRF